LDKAKDLKLKKVGLLGTKFTMAENFFSPPFSAQGITEYHSHPCREHGQLLPARLKAQVSRLLNRTAASIVSRPQSLLLFSWNLSLTPGGAEGCLTLDPRSWDSFIKTIRNGGVSGDVYVYY